MSSQEDEINPFVDPTRYSGDNSGEATLVVGHGVVLTLAADSLNVLGIVVLYNVSQLGCLPVCR